MFRRWLSSFIRKHKNIILDVAKKIGIIILIALVGTSIMVWVNSQRTTFETENSISIYKPTKTVISGKDVSKEDYNNDEEIINKFISFCNEQDIDSAYKLLSDDCKKYLFDSTEKFKTNYYEKIFIKKKDYNLQSWVNDGDYQTYRVRFIDDILSSGEYDNSQKGEDYITIDNSSEGAKININGYIRKEILNKEVTEKNVNISVIERNVFMNYEEYIIKVKNTTGSKIIIDTGEKVNSITLYDKNKVKYNAIKSNIYNLREELLSNVVRTLKFRFQKDYNPEVSAAYIQFTDIVIDLNLYRNKSDNRLNIKVEF